MRHMNKLILTVAVMAALSFAVAAPASAKMVKKVDNFIFFLDQSGSMAQTHADTGMKKMDMAIKTMKAVNQAVPDLDYTSGLFLFAPFEAKSQPGPYSKSGMASAIGSVGTDFDIFGRQTPMGNGLMDIDPVISGLSGDTALIIFTDGYSNIGADPVAQAQALYAKYGGKLCIHVVSFADNAKGKMIIDEIRALSTCTVVADYASLMQPGAMDKYAKDVFYEEVAEMKKPMPKPEPPMAPVVITANLNFGFDKDQVTDEMIPVLEEVKAQMMENDAKYVVAGHTDSIGTEAYNQGLSERRANSIRNWLVANGVPTDRLMTKGYGELSPKYDNGTKEGRRLNRRVEFQVK